MKNVKTLDHETAAKVMNRATVMRQQDNNLSLPRAIGMACNEYGVSNTATANAPDEEPDADDAKRQRELAWIQKRCMEMMVANPTFGAANSLFLATQEFNNQKQYLRLP